MTVECHNVMLNVMLSFVKQTNTMEHSDFDLPKRFQRFLHIKKGVFYNELASRITERFITFRSQKCRDASLSGAAIRR
jgi:hypothetical protein